MSDIVEKVRKYATGSWEEEAVLLHEAADEIERLREAIRMMVRLDKCASPDVYKIAREALGDNSNTTP